MNDERFERAVTAFHDALDMQENTRSCHGWEGDWVDGSADAIVEALLAAGWTPPRRQS
jgi:hypothetical protein